ncbi:unnamed protein product [Notodromas monacha]|uniref:Uncharacterized protein n=1 Tax=Notodromas monacha TaxID=399045 RepID=A0A7R9GKT1_9CRUS|nr:unnamed protein product [Notodromas monacha]CAG0925138.1 unnamed protein product [Notodromas monacha]
MNSLKSGQQRNSSESVSNRDLLVPSPELIMRLAESGEFDLLRGVVELLPKSNIEKFSEGGQIGCNAQEEFEAFKSSFLTRSQVEPVVGVEPVPAPFVAPLNPARNPNLLNTENQQALYGPPSSGGMNSG